MIRLWRLGDHKQGLLPNKESVEKLMNILEKDDDSGTLDIVWDSLIDVTIINDDGTVQKA